MGQIGHHTYEDSTAPIAADTSAVGTHGFAETDNRDRPCNGLASCSEDDTDGE